VHELFRVLAAYDVDSVFTYTAGFEGPSSEVSPILRVQKHAVFSELFAVPLKRRLGP
jgi:hypothetical protein